MNKISYMKACTLLMVWSILFTACQQQASTDRNNPGSDKTKTDTLVNTDSVLLQRSEKLLKKIQAHDDKNLYTFFNKALPTRFSPYAYIDTVKDIKLTGADIEKMENEEYSTLLLWGKYDGSGDEIKMSFTDYLIKFVYTIDFLKRGVVSINQTKASGNSLNNMHEVYKDAWYVEYYFKGTEPYGFMDWQALRLVYKKTGNEWYLAGIIHDQWTI